MDRRRHAVQFEALQRRVLAALNRGVEQTGCRRTQATCQNLLKLWPALWGFVSNPGVPPTNNEAERSIRSIVLKRKIAGPTRSRRGDEFIARGFSVVETCRRRGRNLADYMHQAVIAWIDKAPRPSLLPAPALPTGRPAPCAHHYRYPSLCVRWGAEYVPPAHPRCRIPGHAQPLQEPSANTLRTTHCGLDQSTRRAHSHPENTPVLHRKLITPGAAKSLTRSGQ